MISYSGQFHSASNYLQESRPQTYVYCDVDWTHVVRNYLLYIKL